MRMLIRPILVASVCAGLAGLLWAQAEKKRASPHETTTGSIAGKKITIEYGRPYKKGRTIFGGLEPFGQVWRTGADEATTFTTEAGLMIGNLQVPAGTYGLFTIPEEKQWTLVLNKVAKQWGAFKYEQSQDLGRTPMQVRKLDAPLEQHTITIESAGGNKGVLKIAWDQTEASVGFTVR
jgi:VCBS repeat-containing protein